MKGGSGGQFAYASSKADFIHLARTLANASVEAKIRVNPITPGVFPTGMIAGDSDYHQKSELGSEASNLSEWYVHETDKGTCLVF